MLRVAVVVKNNYISYISYISHISTLGGPALLCSVWATAPKGTLIWNAAAHLQKYA